MKSSAKHVIWILVANFSSNADGCLTFPEKMHEMLEIVDFEWNPSWKCFNLVQMHRVTLLFDENAENSEFQVILMNLVKTKWGVLFLSENQASR